MDLSIIIVNWNSSEFLGGCLESIRSQEIGLELEVIVIDNASHDGSREAACHVFPGSVFIQSEENLGFARANNRAYKQSRGRLVLFLNPDTVVPHGALVSMVATLDGHPEAGALGCRLLNKDGTLQYYCVQPFPTILNQAFSSAPLKRLSLRRIHGAPGTEPIPVDCVSGACLLVKRDIFEQVGCFSDEYFMYSEDVDLCRKIRDSGSLVLYDRRISVLHHEGRSSTKIPDPSFGAVMMAESRYRYFRKFNGSLHAAAYRALLASTSFVRAFVLALANVFASRAGRALIRPRSRKWGAILAWSLGLRMSLR